MLAAPAVAPPAPPPQVPGTYSVGAAVVCSHEGVFYEAIVSATSQRSKKRKLTTLYKVKYDGFSSKWDEWVEAERLQPMTGETLGLAKATQAAAAADKAEKSEEPKPPPAKARRKSGKGGARTNHPAYEEMVLRAIEALKDKTGSSAVAVGKWIKDRFAVNESKYKQSVAQALKALVAQDRLVKIKASFKLSVDELRSRTGQPLQQRRRGTAGPLDDLDVEAKQRAKGANIPQRPMPQATLVLAPPAAAGDVLCVAEFCRTFNDTLGSNLKLTAAELESALSLLPISETPVGAEQDLLVTVATPLPPLIERLSLALLRTVCGRDARDGNFFKPKDDVACVERELFVGHMQNRRVWGHLLNAVTWPDLLRRHLAAERRFRARVREAFPGDINSTSHESILDDDPTLKAALVAYCDQGRSLGSLPPEQCAALLRSLVDDALDTPPIQRLMRDCEFALDQIQKRHKNAATQYKRLERLVISPSLAASPSSGDDEALKVLVRGKTPAELERVMESARADIDAARNAWNEATSTLCLRKDTLGFDRAFSGYWKLDCLDKERVAVRLDPRDARYSLTLAPWNCFDLGVRDGALLKSLDTRGVREAALQQTFKSIAGERPALNVKQMIKASQEATHRIQLAARRHLDVAKVRPPPSNTVAAALPWPGEALPVVEEEVVVDMEDDDEPRRSTRINVPDAPPPSKPSAKVSDEDGTSLKAIERRAERAADRAAPWRWSHKSLAEGFPAIRAQMNAILDRLDRVNDGCLAEGSGRAHRLGNPCSLAALCADALDAEAALASFLAPHDARELDDAEDDSDEPNNNNETNGNTNGNTNNNVDWVESDVASENDYYELCGPCAEVRSWRSLWRRAVESCTSPGPLETVAARFASLFGSLAEAVERHAPAIEARARAAATLLADNGKANIGGLGAVFIPSDPTADMVWARIRGYPWWPAQVHRPKGANFRAALEARNSTLLVFVGEAVQYLLHANAVEKFTGEPDDPRLPKDLKKASKGLLSALKLAKTLQDKALAAMNANNADVVVDDGLAVSKPQDTVAPPGDELQCEAVPMAEGPMETQRTADVPTMNGDRMVEE